MKISTILLLLFAPLCFAQVPQYWYNGNNFRAQIKANGDIFRYNSTYSDGTFLYPQNTNNSLVYSTGLWVGGFDSAYGDLHVTAQLYRSSRDSWKAGPVANSYGSRSYHDNIALIDSQVVADHRQNFQNVGYSVPASIANWPAEGDVSNGELPSLAPYIDYNGNGNYDPENGDYPLSIGRENAFWVFNDTRANNMPSMGLEIRAYLMYLPNISPGMDKAVVINYQLVNRSNRQYQDVMVGAFLDFDIGQYDDDYYKTGGYPAPTHIIGYNGDQQDDVYGSTIPSFGMGFLGHDLFASVNFKGTASFRNGKPTFPSEFYNYMRGRWSNGDPIYGNGEPGNNSGFQTRYVFYNSEEGDVNLVPGDRKGVASIGPLFLRPGGKRCFDVLYMFNDDSPGNTSRFILDSLMTIAQQSFSNWNIGCNNQNLVSSIKNQDDLTTQFDFNISPNPANGKVKVFWNGTRSGKMKIKLLNSLGNPVLEKLVDSSNEFSIELFGVQKGIYVLVLESNHHKRAKKLIVK